MNPIRRIDCHKIGIVRCIIKPWQSVLTFLVFGHIIDMVVFVGPCLRGTDLQKSARTYKNRHAPTKTGTDLQKPARTYKNRNGPTKTGTDLQKSARTYKNRHGPTKICTDLQKSARSYKKIKTILPITHPPHYSQV